MGAHGTPWGLSTRGLGPFCSPGRAGGSREALSSPASLASPRQLPNESRSFLSDIRDAEEGTGGTEGDAKSRYSRFGFALVKLEGLCRKKNPGPAPSGQHLARAQVLFCRRLTGSGGEEMPEPLHRSALPSVGCRVLGESRTDTPGRRGRAPLCCP